MPDYILNFLVNVFLMSFAILSVKDLIYIKHSKKSPFHRIKGMAWVLILFAILSIVFNLYRDWRADLKQEASEIKQLASEKEKKKVDSLFQDAQNKIMQLQKSTKDTIVYEVKNAYTNSIKASNDALAKYHLRYSDSLHSVVSTLKLNALNSQLSISPVIDGKPPAYLNKDKDILFINFISKDGTTYNIILTCYLLIGKNYRPTLLKADKLASGESALIVETTRTLQTNISSNILLQPEVDIFITGSFSRDPEGKIKIPFNDGFTFNFKENKYLGGFDAEYSKIRAFLKIE
ncbi:MAG: hypothetical protein EHM64_01875 [Ignavibacteriae bacterium]|nr:MAG: hypothetical protein EHM64_01875 [Ignavibacteriota bacterium]